MNPDKPIASVVIKKMSAIAWKSRIRGKALKRSSLLMPINEIFDHLRRQQQLLDLDTLQAAINTEIFNYLVRIHDPTKPQFQPGREKRIRVEEFVNCFFDELLQGIYGGKLSKLMTNEKIIKAAYLFYIRNEITPKEETEEDDV
jgi:CRISPR-associated protein Csc3